MKKREGKVSVCNLILKTLHSCVVYRIAFQRGLHPNPWNLRICQVMWQMVLRLQMELGLFIRGLRDREILWIWMGRSNVITESSKVEEKQKRRSEWCESRRTLIIEGETMSKGMCVALVSWTRQVNRFCPRASQKESRHLDFILVRLCCISDLWNYNIIHLCCSKPPRLW